MRDRCILCGHVIRVYRLRHLEERHGIRDARASEWFITGDDMEFIAYEQYRERYLSEGLL